MIQRILSAIIMLTYIIGGYFSEGLEAAFQATALSVLPFFCIWFPNPMGHGIGSRIGGAHITNSSPGCLIQLVGWILLLSPFFTYLLVEYGL